MRLSRFDWDIDWGNRGGDRGLDGSDQIVSAALPRFVGNLSLVLPQPMIGHFRAIRAQVKGRTNALRLRLVDPVSWQSGGGDRWTETWASYIAGTYVDPRPKVVTTAAAAAGATTLSIDESAASEPVRVGAFLSYDDWPFMVVGRSGSGASVTLTVTMLRTAIPNAADVDLNARGLFLLNDPQAGNAVYGNERVGEVTMPVAEWITRS